MSDELDLKHEVEEIERRLSRAINRDAETQAFGFILLSLVAVLTTLVCVWIFAPVHWIYAPG